MNKELDKYFPLDIKNIILDMYYRSMFFDTVKELKKLFLHAYSYKNEKFMQNIVSSSKDTLHCCCLMVYCLLLAAHVLELQYNTRPLH